MKINIKILLIFSLLIFSLLIFTSNLFSYNIDGLETYISVRDNGALEVHDYLFVSNVDSNFLVLDIIPVYDLVIKVDGKKYNYYSYDLDNLEIDLRHINKEVNLNLEIIYLTDFYSSKENSNWIINYKPLFFESVDNFKLDLPINSSFNTLSVDLSKVSFNNNRFSVTDVNVSYLDINYFINDLKIGESSSRDLNYLYLGLVLFIIIVTIFFIFNIRNKKDIYFKSNKKNIETKSKKDFNDLLLGLNENEQKIVKLLLVESGLSQKKISLKLFLPKGTISRNIKKLEEKGYIEIKKYGVTNKVFLSKLFEKKH
ncbi:MAG: winged helix-turn-helix transcriptional regulator [archaeon]|nr:winged helix-turn-helix transcriptional regulator [archaeon]MDD2477449.1 winged helix-turn-helix transcriptional regulator [Candidatus ainarchaeum sp.]MDD3084732.1 winged helix-turn-helix transcriptional regulator [Candidatus ainarchaeum sp.]MDD4220980.1 winged helix-turn-helix transcriptional regulator [Candidatus ainarchaeum sp.]MDD4662448.1 winged helix-turn-helix transcriptional regulator [Candidatus ainarchaeum sp.]